MKFIMNTQQRTINAMGAMTLRLCGLLMTDLA